MMLPDKDLDLVDEVLSTARSVRRKLDFDRPLERSVLYDCINVAVQAPTGITGESWRFVVVDQAAQKAAIAKLYREVLIALFEDRNMPMKPTHQALIDRLHDIPAMIFVCVEGEPMNDNISSHVAYYGSILPAAWSLMLALRARGIGSTWTSLLSSRQAEVAEILNMPGGTVQTVMLPVGYTKGAVLKRAERRPAQEVTYWNSWGAQDV
jgi:nitroreductase